MLRRIIHKIFRRKFVRNYHKHCVRKIGHALLYYKTDPLVFKSTARDTSHTNHWEIVEIVRILNKLGYWVDVIDRTANLSDIQKNIKDKYDIFIGLGAGNSGRYYPEVASKTSSALKVLYATGSETELSKALMLKRYDYFYKRYPGTNVKVRRVIRNVDINKVMSYTDVIFSIGNEFSAGSYRKFGKPIFRINPSSSPNLRANIFQLQQRNPRKFVYFGGNGNIVKGLDLAIEAFSQIPELELYICAPKEPDFDNVYSDVIARSKNIHFLGFIEVGGSVFNKLVSKCGYVILPSSSEGIATSVTTCMRCGLVPVVTRECGIDVGDFGHIIGDVEVGKLADQIKKISKVSLDELYERSVKTYLDSFKYTQAGF